VTAPVSVDVVRAMARQLLAGLEQEPVAWIVKNKATGEMELDEPHAIATNPGYWTDAFPAYAAPQLPQPAVLSAPDGVLKSLLPDAENPDFWFEHNGKIFFEGVKFNNAVFEACRAAMLQGKAELPAYEIKRFGEFGANGLTRDDGELAISIQLFNFERGTTPELERGVIVEKYALQAIINALQQQCDQLSDTPIPAVWPAAPQQEVDNG